MQSIVTDDLGFDEGASLLIKRALRQVPVGTQLVVQGSEPDLGVHLGGWCRQHGHGWQDAAAGSAIVGTITAGPAAQQRWAGAERAGGADAERAGAVVDRPKASWGLAARGATVELGAPAYHFGLDTKQQVWAEEAAQLYTKASAAQWDPNTAIPWDEPFDLPDEVEDAVVQVMTYMIENENAALLVPARALGQIHPHFREVMQLLAIQIADEARHVEVMTRRIRLHGRVPALSTVGGQASLKTLFDHPEWSVALFLLSVLGEGTFVNLLNFLHTYAPDPVTRQLARLVAQDEARHVAHGMAHLRYQLRDEPALRERLARAVHQRHEELLTTDGLNEEVFDALALLAAGSWRSEDLRAGHVRRQTLKQEMADGRRQRLVQLGFDEDEAGGLSDLHTRNFM